MKFLNRSNWIAVVFMYVLGIAPLLAAQSPAQMIGGTRSADAIAGNSPALTGVVTIGLSSTHWIPKNGGLIDVRDFGFSQIASGAANATALANAVAALTNRSVLELPAGNYALTAKSGISMTGKENVIIRGAGRGATILVFKGTAAISPTSCHNLTIKDLSISGAMQYGIYLATSNDALIDNVSVTGATSSTAQSAGIRTVLCNDVKIKNSKFSGNGSYLPKLRDGGDIMIGYQNQGGTGALVENCEALSSAGNFGIAFFDTSGVKAVKNTVRNVAGTAGSTGGYGIVAYSFAYLIAVSPPVHRDVIIDGNTIEKTTGSGIYVQYMRDSVVINNNLKNVCQTQNDVSLAAGAIVVERGPGTLANNNIDGSGKNGIVLYGYTGDTNAAFTVNGGTIKGAGKWALQLRNECNGAQVNGLNIRNSARGIHIVASDDVSIKGGTVIGTIGRVSAVQVNGDSQRLKIDGLSLLNLAAGGIELFPSSGTISWAKLTNCIISGIGPAYVGVYLRNTTNSQVEGFQIIDENNDANYAVQESAGTRNNLIQNIEITGSYTVAEYALSAATTTLHRKSTTFSKLLTPANGSRTYCSDCAVGSTCAGSGTGADARRINGVWVCN